MILYILTLLVVGLIAGWLANTILKKNNNDMKNNLVIGVIGSFVGGLVGSIIGIHASNLIGSIIMAVIGAIIASYIYDKFIK